MSNLPVILEAILPVLATFLLGSLARKTNLITLEGAQGFKSVILNILLPVVVFQAMSHAKISLSELVLVLAAFLICLTGFLIGKAIHRVRPSTSDLLPFFISSYEVGMLGYALYIVLFGSENLRFIAVPDIGLALSFFSFFLPGLFMRKYGSRKAAVLSLFRSPCIYGVVTGVLFSVTGLAERFYATVPGGIANTLESFIAAPTSFMILFVLGYGSRFSREVVRSSLKIIALRLTVIAALGTAVLTLLPRIVTLDIHYIWAIVMILIMPPAYMMAIFTKDREEDNFVSGTLSLYTLVTLILYGLVVVFAMA